MRAGLVDLVVECGTDFMKGFQLFMPTGLQRAAGAVVAGERFYLDGAPELVYSAELDGTGGVLFTFRQGLWWQPRLHLSVDALVMPATALPLLAAEAAWSDPYQRHAITTWTSDSATMAVVQMPAHETQAREGWIGTWPWDLYVATDRYGWSRLAEGSLTFVLGDARSLSPMMPEVARA